MCCKNKEGKKAMGHKGTKAQRRTAGFSFIEIMVVVVIIGLLAGAVTLQVTKYIDKARITRVKSDMSSLIIGIEAYYAENSRYPESGADLGEVLDLTNNVDRDPWGNEYIYERRLGGDPSFEVLSLGADGLEGGEGLDADISSLSLGEEEGQ